MSESLANIRAQLARLYDVDPPEVEPFLCDEEQARAAVGDGVERGEVLLVLEEPDGVSIGLYVAEPALALLAERSEGRAELKHFEAFCLAAEGVSHLVYLIFRVRNDQSVTQLELELQAEVDKWATAILEMTDSLNATEHRATSSENLRGLGVNLVRERSRDLRQKLFEAVVYLDAPGTEAGDRYRLATRAAARYAARLEELFLARGDMVGLVAELRRFYRLGGQEKLLRTQH